MSVRLGRTAALFVHCSALALLVQAAPASAQQAAPPPAAQAEDVLDAVTVVATKTEERAIDTLAAVSTIRREQIDQILPKRLSDVFFGTPGVWFQESGDDPETAINIRGLQDFGRVAVVVDGARQNFARLSHDAAGSFYFDPELLAEADVVRGPVANIYGSGAIGGVVSLRTKDVDDVLKPDETWGVVGHGLIGSNMGRGLGSMFGAARINPNLDMIVGGSFRSNSDYKDGDGNTVLNSAQDIGSGLAKVTVRPADGHEVKIGGIAYDAKFDTGQATDSQFDTHVTNNTVTAKWRYSRPEDRLFDFDANVYWNGVASDQTKIAGSSNPITGAIGDTRSFKIDTYGFDVNNSTRFELGSIYNTLTYGVDYFYDKVENNDSFGFADGYNPSGNRRVSGGFLQWKGNITQWLEVIGALRYDRYELEGLGVANEGDRISPKITVGVTPVDWLTVYGTYAEGYRAPAVTETLVTGAHPSPQPGWNSPFTFLPNPNLRPEVGKTKEVGLNIKQDNLFLAGDRLRLKANIYRNDVEDFIELAEFGPPQTMFSFCPAPFPGCPPVPLVTINNPYSFAQYQNISNAQIDGVEFEGTYDTGTWFFGLSGHRIRGRDVATGEPLAKIAPDQIATTIGTRFWDGKWTIAVRWAAVAGKSEDDLPTNSLFEPTGSYNLVNLYLGYQPTEDVLAAFSVDNLLNEQYTRYMDTTASPGITFKGSLRIRYGAKG